MNFIDTALIKTALAAVTEDLEKKALFGFGLRSAAQTFAPRSLARYGTKLVRQVGRMQRVGLKAATKASKLRAIKGLATLRAERKMIPKATRLARKAEIMEREATELQKAHRRFGMKEPQLPGWKTEKVKGGKGGKGGAAGGGGAPERLSVAALATMRPMKDSNLPPKLRGYPQGVVKKGNWYYDKANGQPIQQA